MSGVLGGLLASFSPASTAFESIATSSPTSGTSVTFSSIPSTYKHLQIRFTHKTATAGAQLRLQFNSDTGTNYSRHKLQGNGTTAAATGNATVAFMYIGSDGSGSDTTYLTTGICDIHDYASSTKNKTMRNIVGIDKNGSGDIALYSGAWYNTNAITSITITSDGANFASGSTFALYGIKGA
jgi:hypothetical protein